MFDKKKQFDPLITRNLWMNLMIYSSAGCMQLPSFVDWFGWCTWDAFYTDVTAEGVEEGLKRLLLIT